MVGTLKIVTCSLCLLLTLPGLSNASITAINELFPSVTTSDIDLQEWAPTGASSAEKELLTHITVRQVGSSKLPNFLKLEEHIDVQNDHYDAEKESDEYVISVPFNHSLVGVQFLNVSMLGLAADCHISSYLRVQESVITNSGTKTSENSLFFAIDGVLIDLIKPPESLLSNRIYLFRRIFGTKVETSWAVVERPDFKVVKVLPQNPLKLAASIAVVFDMKASPSHRDFVNLRINTSAGTDIITVPAKHFQLVKDRIEIRTSHIYSELARETNLPINEIIRSAKITEFIIHKHSQNARDQERQTSNIEVLYGIKDVTRDNFDAKNFSISYRGLSEENQQVSDLQNQSIAWIPFRVFQQASGTAFLLDMSSQWAKPELSAKSFEIKIKRENDRGERCFIEKAVVSGFTAGKQGAVDLMEAHLEILRLQGRLKVPPKKNSFVSINVHSRASWAIDHNLNAFSTSLQLPQATVPKPLSVIIDPDIFSKKINKIELIHLISIHEQFNEQLDDLLMFLDASGAVLPYTVTNGVITFEDFVEIKTVKVDATKHGVSIRETFDVLIIAPFANSRARSWGILDLRKHCILLDSPSLSKTLAMEKVEADEKAVSQLVDGRSCDGRIFDFIKGIYLKNMKFKLNVNKPNCMRVVSRAFTDVISPQTVCLGLSGTFFLPINEPFQTTRVEVLEIIRSLMFEKIDNGRAGKAKYNAALDYELEFSVLGSHFSEDETYLGKAVSLEIDGRTYRLGDGRSLKSYLGKKNNFLMKALVPVDLLHAHFAHEKFSTMKLTQNYEPLSWRERQKKINLEWVGLYKSQ